GINATQLHALQRLAPGNHALGRHKGGRPLHGSVCARASGNLLPVVQDVLMRHARRIQLDVRQHRQHAVAHLDLKAVHHGKHDDQRRHAQRNAGHGACCNEGDESVSGTASPAASCQPRVSGSYPELIRHAFKPPQSINTTMRGMQIVLPGALPDAAIAHELAPHLEKNAPRLATWLARAHADIISAKPAETFCTPYEYWLLRHHGFKAGDGESPACGLAAVYARDTQADSERDHPLRLAHVGHVARARGGAALVPAGELEIGPEESAALYAAAEEYFEGSGFAAEPFDTSHWRLHPRADYRPVCASPALV